MPNGPITLEHHSVLECRGPMWLQERPLAVDGTAAISESQLSVWTGSCQFKPEHRRPNSKAAALVVSET